MKAAQIHAYGGSDIIDVASNVPMPVVSAGKVLVKIHAAGLNPFDWKIRAGYMKDFIPLTFPTTLGGDFSGVVIDVGEGVTHVAKDDAVYGSAIVLSGGTGALAEYALVLSDRVAKKPARLHHTEAAALPVAGISALQAITELMKISKGQKLLIHGGSGGIGTYSIQLAKHLGAYIATTVRADAKEYVASLGADEVIDFEHQKFEEILHEYDAVLDTVGGATNEASYSVLKKGGMLVSMVEQPKGDRMAKYGVQAVSLNATIDTNRLHQLAQLVDDGTITVQIDRTFSFEETKEAFSYLESSHRKGKVVVNI